jgi:transposase InsO family protein
MVLKIIKEGQTLKDAAASFSVCPKTAGKWLARYRAEGLAGLQDRSSQPHRSPRRTPEQKQAQVASRTGLSEATLSRLLRQVPRHPPPPVSPVIRYERTSPGELLHLDIKRLGRIDGVGHRITADPKDRCRGAGRECVHVCIDDHSRVAFADLLADQKRESAVGFLESALAYYASLGVRVQRIMTDNGSCCRSAAFHKACARHALKHLRTRLSITHKFASPEIRHR